MEIGSIALCKSGERLLMSLATTFAFFYLKDHSLEMLKSSYKRDTNEGSRLNDGRVDRKGRFVVGGLNFIFGGQKLYSVSYEKEGELSVKTI
jgi:sugar lactone lactonase YvrE